MRVLLIEDSDRLRRSLTHGLKGAGWAVDAVSSGEEGLAFLETYDYDIAVLDLMLPGLPGLEVMRRLRERGSQVHVLILSARDRVEDRVQGLALGADDYLVKPFSFDELCARLQALVRRRYRAKSPILDLADLTIDTSAKTVARDGEVLHLTPSEYAILEMLLMRHGRVTSRSEILEHLYDGESEVSSNVVEVMISGLRRKVGEQAARQIRTRRGFGYVIE